MGRLIPSTYPIKNADNRPESMLSVVLVPVIKDKAGKMSSKDNYLPIALASVISKLVEVIMLDRIYY